MGNKNVFWEALLVAVFIFSAGILIGFLFENWRTSQIKDLYQQSEMDLLDVKIQTEIYSFEGFDCDSAIEENINFADRIFQEAQLLDKFETSNKISDAIVYEHKRFDLLRVLFWINSIKIKDRCNASYHNVVYIYDYNNPRLDTRAKQETISRLLIDLKSEYGNRIMLIPFAGDNDISSISILMRMYGITEEELPVVLIDEKIKLNDIQELSEIKKYLN